MVQSYSPGFINSLHVTHSFFRPTRVHNRNCVWIGSPVVSQLMPVSSGMSCPLKIAPSHEGIWMPYLIHDSLSPSEIKKPNGISTVSSVFAQHITECLCTLQWAAPSALKIARSRGDLGLSLGPNRVLTQTASQSTQPFLQGSLV